MTETPKPASKPEDKTKPAQNDSQSQTVTPPPSVQRSDRDLRFDDTIKKAQDPTITRTKEEPKDTNKDK